MRPLDEHAPLGNGYVRLFSELAVAVVAGALLGNGG